MQQTIVEYKAKKGETLEQALWSSGVYRKKDLRSFKDAADGKPVAVYTLYDSAYLVNGRCHNCSLPGRHQPHCPGAHMKTIKNILMPTCPLCNSNILKDDEKWCSYCETSVMLDCGCYSPGYCDCLDDEEFCEGQKKVLKDKLTSLGIETN